MTTNVTTITGNLTRDPELRFTQSGRAVANAAVAVNRRFMQNGEWVDGPTTFYDLVIWGSLGENVAASLTKGTRVLVSGRMESREWEKDGNKRISWELIVDEMGPSLTYATAEVARTERTTTTQPAPRPAPAPVPAPEYVYGDEEPF